VQLAAQSARAAARLGDADGVRAGLARAAAWVDRQTGDRPPDHHFTFDARKLEGYTATALAWARDPAGEDIARGSPTATPQGRRGAWPRPGSTSG
jgi:hypothetical protein